MRSTRGPTRWLPWLWLGAIFAASLVVVATSGRTASSLAFGIVPSFFGVLGVVVAVRRPGNRIAWLFLLSASAFLVEPLAMLVLVERPTLASWPVVVAAAGMESAYFVAILAVFLIVLVFPTGTFLNRRWSFVGWLAGFLAAEVTIVNLLLDELLVARLEWTAPNPHGVLPVGLWRHGEVVDGPLGVVFGLGLVVVILSAIPAIVLRYRRSSAEVRVQIRAVAWALAVFAVAFAVNLLTPGEGDLWGTLSTLALLLVPVSITAAITRYRLWDIDRMISRTVGYTIVVAVLGAVYLVVATWLPTRLMGRQPAVFVAAATLSAAALFNPVRRRVLAAVDRRFFRSRYDAEVMVREFVDQVRTQHDPAEVIQLVAAAVATSMGPSSVGVWTSDAAT